MDKYIEIENYNAIAELIVPGQVFRHYAFQNIEFGRDAICCQFSDCIFFGCTMPEEVRRCLGDDCYLFPKMNVPYNIFRASLYSPAELYNGFNPNNPESYSSCFDARVYAHYMNKGKQAVDIAETFARTMHDHSISDALYDMLSLYDERSIVAVMGGHALLRTDATYRSVVIMGKHLTERGALMVTGGGPGAMEATHLGAWLAGRPDAVVDEAIALLVSSPSYKDAGWLSSALEVMERFPRIGEHRSIGVPTWFYGHEPATPFATHIAKYFDNSIREDGLLTIAKGGVIYSPGSAGTMQEIFQDAAQNHYLTCGYASPMVFFGSEYWTERFPVYSMLTSLHCKGCYKNLLLSLTDNPDEAVDTIMNFVASNRRHEK